MNSNEYARLGGILLIVAVIASVIISLLGYGEIDNGRIKILLTTASTLLLTHEIGRALGSQGDSSADDSRERSGNE